MQQLYSWCKKVVSPSEQDAAIERGEMIGTDRKDDVLERTDTEGETFKEITL